MSHRTAGFSAPLSALAFLAACSGSGGPRQPAYCDLAGDWVVVGTPVEPEDVPCVPLGLESFSSSLRFLATSDPQGGCAYLASAPGLEGAPQGDLSSPLVVAHASTEIDPLQAVVVDGLYYRAEFDVTVDLGGQPETDAVIAPDRNSFRTRINYRIYEGYQIAEVMDDDGEPEWGVLDTAVLL